MGIYQPNRQGYQSKKECISQTDKDISQKKNISANHQGYQPKKEYISQTTKDISQNRNISAKPKKVVLVCIFFEINHLHICGLVMAYQN